MTAGYSRTVSQGVGHLGCVLFVLRAGLGFTFRVCGFWFEVLGLRFEV